MKRSTRAARPTLLPLAALGFASMTETASAETGQLEINATCAIQTGCFPGDTPG